MLFFFYFFKLKVIPHHTRTINKLTIINHLALCALYVDCVYTLKAIFHSAISLSKEKKMIDEIFLLDCCAIDIDYIV